MFRPMSLVASVIALAAPVLLWQAVAAESLNELAWIRVPMHRMDSESSTLLMIGCLLIGASSLARRVMGAKPLRNGDSRPSAPVHEPARSPGI